jgi:hypothetical protein
MTTLSCNNIFVVSYMIHYFNTDQAYRIEENEWNVASMATRRTDQAYRIEENERNAASMATRRTDPSYRITEQNADNNRRRLTATRRTTNQAYRIEENERNDGIMDGINGRH